MIRLSNVKKSYDGKDGMPVVVVDNVSLEVPTGKLLVLLGRAGCGKTTTLEMINGLTKPDEGTVEVWVDNRNLADTKNPVELRRKIGYVIQGSALFPHMTVRENIAVVPQALGPAQGWTEEAINKRVDELLGLVALPAEKFGERLPHQLSGGQQQRVGFARALAARPKVVLLDEPFGALDPETREDVRGVFLRLQREFGLTAVMVTHDMAEALLSADRIAVMDAGKILQEGSPHELMTNPAHPFVKTMIDTPRHQAEAIAALNLGGQPA